MNLRLILILLTMTLTSASIEGEPCQFDADCQSLNSCINKVCQHKTLFPIEISEIFASLWIVFLNSISTAAGLGFGGAMVPYFQLFMHYSQSSSISIAYIATFGGGLGNLLNIIKIRNKETGGPMINYNIALVVIPSLVIGSQLGVLLRRIIPSFVSSLVLLAIVSYGFKNYFYKFRHQYKIEHEIMHPPSDQKSKTTNQKSSEAKGEITKDAPPNTQGGHHEHHKDHSHIEDHPKDVPFDGEVEISIQEHPKTTTQAWKEKRTLILQREIQIIPWYKIREALLLILVIFVLVIIRGGKGISSVAGVQYCSAMDFGVLGIQIFVLVLSLLRNVWLIKGWEKEKEFYKLPNYKDYFKLDTKKIFKLSSIGIVGGIIGAIASLGGGVFIVPVLFKMGMSPAVASFTSGSFTIFTTFNSALQIYFTGAISGQQIGWFCCLSLVFSYVSARVVAWVLKKTGKQAFLPLMIAIIFASSFILIATLLVLDGLNNWNSIIAAKKFC